MEVKSELARQIAHLLFGIGAIGVFALLYVTLGRYWHPAAILLTLAALYATLFLISTKVKGGRIPLIDNLFSSLGARDIFPGEGMLWYLLGILLLLSFFARFSYVLGSIYILAVGDSVSTAVNLPSRHRKKSIFKNKTPISILAFIIFSVPIAFLIGTKAIPLVVACAIAEAIDLKINDNFLIPLVCVVLLSVL